MGLNDIQIKKSLLQQGINLFNSKAIHLAIVNDPYYKYILEGTKTIESRFSNNRVAPYNKISPNDIVLMKKAGRSIEYLFFAGEIMYYKSTSEIINDLKKSYSKEICANEEFWEARREKKYITLIRIKKVQKTKENIFIEKKDKRGWVTFNNNTYKKVYLISGSIGSGKTWLSTKLSILLNCDRCSFSDYVKWKCEQSGITLTRENLNRIGEIAINNDLPEFIYYLFNCTTEKTSDTLIIDGLRHIEVLDEVAKYCENYEIIYIDSDDNIIKENLLTRNTLEEDYRQHSIEEQLPVIKERANLIIEHSGQLDVVVNHIKSSQIAQISLFDK